MHMHMPLPMGVRWSCSLGRRGGGLTGDRLRGVDAEVAASCLLGNAPSVRTHVQSRTLLRVTERGQVCPVAMGTAACSRARARVLCVCAH